MHTHFLPLEQSVCSLTSSPYSIVLSQITEFISHPHQVKLGCEPLHSVIFPLTTPLPSRSSAIGIYIDMSEYLEVGAEWMMAISPL
jgi:hypothetical protein